MSWNQIKELQERRAALAQSSKAILNVAQNENRSLNADENVKFDSIMKDVEVLDQRITDLKRQATLEDSLAAGAEKRGEQREYEKSQTGKAEARKADAVGQYLRSAQIGDKFDCASPLGAEELRATTVKGSNTIGPQDFFSTVVGTAIAYNGVLGNGADIQYTSNGNPLPIFCDTDASQTGELIAENTDAANLGISYSIKTLGAYKMGSKEIVVSDEMIEDAGFDVTSWVAARAGTRIGRISNSYMTTGTGSSQPGGIMYQAATGKTAASATTFTYSELLDLYHSVDVAYRNDPTFSFMFNDSVAVFLRKMVDAGNHYIWEPGRAGEPDLILGKKYIINSACDSAFTAGKQLVGCGALSAYKVRIVNGINLKRGNELYMKAGNVVFYATMRCDGVLSDTTAFKKLVLA